MNWFKKLSGKLGFKLLIISVLCSIFETATHRYPLTPKTDSTSVKPPTKSSGLPISAEISISRKRTHSFIRLFVPHSRRRLTDTPTHQKRIPLPRSPLQRVVDFPSQQRFSPRRKSPTFVYSFHIRDDDTRTPSHPKNGFPFREAPSNG